MTAPPPSAPSPSEPPSAEPPAKAGRPRRRRRLMILAVLAVFLLPLAVRAVLHAAGETPRSWRDADWSSIGSLPPAAAHPEARVLVLTGRTGGWKGVVAVHSWVVLKEKNARSWSRWDVVGWGNPVRMNGWAPDGRWYGNPPIVVADVSGEAAEALIPRIRAAIRGYQWANAGDYRVWPGPNSNTFVASVLRAVPELETLLPANAVGRDFRPGAYVGPSDSGTGVEASAWGVVGVKAGWVEGLELNLLGLVVGLDIRRPALKLPGYGRIGLDPLPSAAAAGR